MRFSAQACWLLGIVQLIATGCGSTGPELVHVAGTVQVDGQPLEKGSIAFIAQDGSHTAAGQIQAGNYEITKDIGPRPGLQKVSISGFRKSGQKANTNKMGMFAEISQKTGGGSGPAATEEGEEQFLPAKFNTETTLTAELKSGKNPSTDFKLDTK